MTDPRLTARASHAAVAGRPEVVVRSGRAGVRP